MGPYKYAFVGFSQYKCVKFVQLTVVSRHPKEGKCSGKIMFTHPISDMTMSAMPLIITTHMHMTSAHKHVSLILIDTDGNTVSVERENALWQQSS